MKEQEIAVLEAGQPCNLRADQAEAFTSLADLQLALVGGGVGEVVAF